MANEWRGKDLVFCQEHGVCLVGDERRGGWCPCCRFGVDAEPEQTLVDRLTGLEFRNRIEPGTFERLIPLMKAYVGSREGLRKLRVGVASWEGVLPAGYNETERHLNVVIYQAGMLEKAIVGEENAAVTVGRLAEEFEEEEEEEEEGGGAPC